jgi:hypothetical protein
MEQITDLIKNGLLRDLIITERSFLLNKKIKDSTGKLSSSTKLEISKILYDLTYTELVLGLCRLFDTPKNYPTRCLKQLYNIVEVSENIIKVKDRTLLFDQIQHLGVPPEFVKLLKSSSPIDFNKRAIAFFEAEEMNDPIRSSIRTVKDKRDKLLAHNEDINLTSFLPYNSIETLLNHAKNVVSFFGLAYSAIILNLSITFILARKPKIGQLYTPNS